MNENTRSMKHELRIMNKDTKIHDSKFKIHTSVPKGFTLIEILLVIAAISILASIVIVAINPAKQLAEARNAQRRSDVNTILNAIWQEAIDSDGALDVAINISATCVVGTADANVVCKTPGGTCTGITDLSSLTDSEKYLVKMPVDPKETDTNKTGYVAVKSTNGRVTVCAPRAEESATISVRR